MSPGQAMGSSDLGGGLTYDFKGHAVEVARQLVALDDVDKTVDWDAPPGAGIAALDTSETFTTEQSYDALDRIVESVTPDGSVTTYAYNEAGLLESVEVDVPGDTHATAFVEGIDYDEKGRRTEITYGNGTTTTHTYDPLTFRLTRLKTRRASDSVVLQDLRYVYDAVGNIVEVQDEAQQTEFFANAVVSPTQKYEYDALYRLVKAKGRQKQTMSGIPNHTDPSKGGIPDGTAASPGAMNTYERRYSYDGVGNILEMKQVSAWTRTYAYAADSNRLASTTEAGGTKNYRYNARGAMTSMAHLDHASTGLDDPMVSDFRDQLAQVALNSGGDTVRFHYDPTRERVRKVWTKGAIVEERIYLGGWELWRKHNSAGVTDERETLHVLDGESRIAMVETLTVGSGSSTPVSRFQLGNHLGSASLELDADGELLTYEEFFPYGSTSWWAERSASPVSHKRYRYIGKEKDEETGLHYHSARYFAGWLGRWTSSDPAGLVDGVGRYNYTYGGPIALSDGTGLAEAPKPEDPHATRRWHFATVDEVKFWVDSTGNVSMDDLLMDFAPSHVRFKGKIWTAEQLYEESVHQAKIAAEGVETFIDPVTGEAILNSTREERNQLIERAHNSRLMRILANINSGPFGALGSIGGLMDRNLDKALIGGSIGAALDSSMDLAGGTTPFSGQGQRMRERGAFDTPRPSQQWTEGRHDAGGWFGPLRRRVIELGTDADTGRINIREGVAGVRLEAKLGISLRRGESGADFVDTKEGGFGRISLKGPLPPKARSNVGGLIASAKKDLDLNSGADTLVIDLTGLSLDQAAAVVAGVKEASIGARYAKRLIFVNHER